LCLSLPSVAGERLSVTRLSGNLGRMLLERKKGPDSSRLGHLLKRLGPIVLIS
jgi:hypothetical protein